jgi:hypothetical protein
MYRASAGAPGAWHDAGQAGAGGFVHLNALEIAFAYSKMRARKTPGNQAHVTNAKDDPLQLAADAAVAVAFGFDEIETTMRVPRNAWSNALACRWAVLCRPLGHAVPVFVAKRPRNCASAWPASPPMPRRSRSTARRSSFHRRRRHALVEGLSVAAYASRGIKMRCTSGAGAELLMGFTRQSRCSISRRAASACNAAWACRARRTAASTARRSPPHAGRHARADGREPHRGLARSGMRLGNDARNRIRDPRRRQDHALSDRRIGSHLLGLRLDPQIRQLVQPLASSTARRWRIIWSCSAISRRTVA